MKLTNRELNLVEGIDQLQRQKIKGLVGVVIAVVAYFFLRYFDALRGFDIPFDTLMIAYVTVYIGSASANIRSEDRHLELLRRYVNSDADTIAALSARRE